MSNPKRHHYVPRTYLKNFASKNKDEYKVFVLDKGKKNIFKSNILNVAVEKDFYTVETMKDKYVWEKYYGEYIEPFMGNFFKSFRQKCENCLIQDDTYILNKEDKMYLAELIAIQFLRGIHTRNYEKQLFKENLPEIFEEAGNKFKNIEADKMNQVMNQYRDNEALFKEIAMRTTIEESRVAEYAKYLLNKIWIVYRNDDDLEFVTSDNPVMVMDAKSFDVTPFHNGIAKRNTIIFYPVSPKILVGIYFVRDERLLLNLQDGKLNKLLNQDNFVNFINKKQFEQCSRQVYSFSKKALEKIR